MIRKATVNDVKNIKQLINVYSEKHLMLPRSMSELYENIRDFFVCEEEGQIIGCGALHVFWEDMGEIISLAVREDRQRQYIGSKLLSACIEEGYKLGIHKVITLTYAPGFFEKHGFVYVAKSMLPHKIWGMCIKCPNFPDCDEIPMMKEI